MKTTLRLTIVAFGLAIFNLSAASVIQFSALTYNVTEGVNAQVEVAVQRANDLDTVVSVDVATAAGTATNGLEYTAVSGTLTFGAGGMNKDIALPAILASDTKAQTDGLYAITFTDGGANVGSGQIDVESGFAISGHFDVTSGTALGDWTLSGGTTAYPNQLLSPAGAFNYDNAVYLATNPQYPTTNLFLDIGGLLFTDTNANEINLWGNADGSYSFFGAINNVRYDPAVIGVATITQVPEPSNVFILALLFLAVGLFVRTIELQRHDRQPRG